jgi:hypothetical protein
MSPEERDRIVSKVAAAYARKCWWADPDDLVQVGREAALRAARTFDPRVGVPETAYLRRSVAFAIRGWLWHESAPVSGGTQDQRRGLHRAPIEDEDGPLIPCGVPSPEELAEEKRYIEALRARMEEACAYDPHARSGLRSLLRDVYPAESGESAHDGYKARGAARRCLRDDPVLWRMLRRKESE